MSNVYAALKSEIVRITRKEIRAETIALKQSNTQHRIAISALKKQIQALEKTLRQSSKSASKALSPAVAGSPAQTSPVSRRFSSSRLAAHRAKLGISAAAYGKLIGMSGAAVYLWEKGEARPSPQVIDALARIKEMPPTAIQGLLSKT